MIKSVNLVYALEYSSPVVCKIIELNADMRYVWKPELPSLNTMNAYKLDMNECFIIGHDMLKHLIEALRLLLGSCRDIRDIGHCLIDHGGYGMHWAVNHRWICCCNVSLLIEELTFEDIGLEE